MISRMAAVPLHRRSLVFCALCSLSIDRFDILQGCLGQVPEVFELIGQYGYSFFHGAPLV